MTSSASRHSVNSRTSWSASSAERAAALPDFLSEYRHRRSPTLNGHTPLCRFFGVNDLSGNHT